MKQNAVMQNQQEEEDEIDPLDAFFNDIDKQIKEQDELLKSKVEFRFFRIMHRIKRTKRKLN